MLGSRFMIIGIGYSNLIPMKHTLTYADSPPFLKHSLISFHQYCNRDVFAHHTLLYSHHQQLSSTATNRRRYAKTTCNASLPKTTRKPTLLIGQHPHRTTISRLRQNEGTKQCTGNQERESTENVELKGWERKASRLGILNIEPAVMHVNSENRDRSLMLSQRVSNQTKYFQFSRLPRSKTESFDFTPQKGSPLYAKYLQGRHSFNFKSRGVQQRVGLDKIKVHLPGPSRYATRQAKDEGINGWDNFLEDEPI